MTDKLEALERLSKLKADGILSEDEFAAQKAALLGGGVVEPARTFGERWREGREKSRGMRRFLRWFWGVQLLAILLIGIYFFTRASEVENARRSEATASAPTGSSATVGAPAVDSPESPVWTTASETDAMSDENVTSATARLVSDGFNIDTVLSCRGGKVLTYQMTAFDDQGKPAGLRRRPLQGNAYIQEADYALRFDAGPEIPTADYNQRYSNVVSFNSTEPSSDSMSLAEQAGRAQKVAVRLDLQSGQPTVVIDQTDSNVQSVLRSCLPQVDANRRAEQARQLAYKADCPNRVAKKKALLAAKIAEQRALGNSIPGYMLDGNEIKADWQGNPLEVCDTAP